VQTATIHHSQQVREAAASPLAFIPLELERRPAVDTAAAAHYLVRKPQTLRGWACHEDGPIRPMRINGRLAWKTADIRALLRVAA
jgi:hypothetical protein